MKKMILLTSLLLLSACGTLQGKLENRVACTVAHDKAFFVSEYGPLGIASTIANQDRDVICK